MSEEANEAGKPAAPSTPSIQFEKQLEILNDHYNETFKLIDAIWVQRNRTALYLYLLGALLLIPPLHGPLAKEYLGIDAVRPQLIYLLGLPGLLALLVLFTQRTSFLDRHYKYINGMEERIELLSGHPLVAREGRFYELRDVPPSEKSATLPYKHLYDLLMVALVLGVLIILWKQMIEDIPPDRQCVLVGGEKFDQWHRLIFVILTAGFVWVLGAFFLRRSKIIEAAGKQSDKFKEDLSARLRAASPEDIRGAYELVGLKDLTGLQGPPGARGEGGAQGARGEPGLNWRGAWDAGAGYRTGDAVSHAGSSWVARRDGATGPPAEGDDWHLLAQKGEPGEPSLAAPGTSGGS